MKERPIDFSADMVRALLQGRKTQTRRPVKPQPESGPDGKMVDLGSAWGLLDGILSGEWCCPYGQPGDRFWVREAWGMSFVDNVPKGRAYRSGGTWGSPAQPERVACVVYLADGPIPPCNLGGETARPSASTHMYRWMSRITLEITNVRVERVQDISEDDARAEAVGRHEGMFCDCREKFSTLWDSINAKKGFGWSVNPWVWVVEFKRVKA